MFCVTIKGVIITEEYNVMVNSEELTGTTEYLTLQMRNHINRCRYMWVLLYFITWAYLGAPRNFLKYGYYKVRISEDMSKHIFRHFHSVGLKN
jgi:hypothetical protein